MSWLGERKTLGDLEEMEGVGADIEIGGSDDPFADEVPPEKLPELREKLVAILSADPSKCYQAGTKEVLPPEQWPRTERLAVQRWSHNPQTDTWNITFHDKNRAADQLARIEGLYKADHEQAANPFAAILDQIPRPVLRLFLAELKRAREAANDAG